uniref:Uncharacterized protein n=1 Tax=Amphimedon queenslandica TaxID=400682 RepID=A0A1X7TKD2_AMPQE
MIIKQKWKVLYLRFQYELEYSKKLHSLNPGYNILQNCKNWYSRIKDSKISKSTCYSRKNHSINLDLKKGASR